MLAGVLQDVCVGAAVGVHLCPDQLLNSCWWDSEGDKSPEVTIRTELFKRIVGT